MATCPAATYRWFFTRPGIFSVLTSKYSDLPVLPVKLFFKKHIDLTDFFFFLSLHKKAKAGSPADVAKRSCINLHGTKSVYAN